MNAKTALDIVMTPGVLLGDEFRAVLEVALREKLTREEAATPREPISWGALQCWADWAAEQVGCDGSHEREHGRNVSDVLRVVEEQVVPFLDSLSGVTYIPHKIPSFVNTEESRVVGSWRFVLAALDKARTPGA